MRTVIATWRPKGRTTRQGRIAQLTARLETETDPRARERLQAQLNYFAFRASS
jgi:hypothetical protein